MKIFHGESHKANEKGTNALGRATTPWWCPWIGPIPHRLNLERGRPKESILKRVGDGRNGVEERTFERNDVFDHCRSPGGGGGRDVFCDLARDQVDERGQGKRLMSMPCRTLWIPILFSQHGTEIAWWCPRHGVHQRLAVQVNWDEGE